MADKLQVYYKMKAILIIFSIILTQSNSLFAKTMDSTKALLVGDTVTISPCPQNGFKHIQYYKKTRFPNPNATYNKETGDDFYEYFFLDGDFDVKILPCEYGNKKYKILSLRVFVDKNTGQDRRVMFLELEKNTVAWVELDLAVENWEVYIEL